MANKPVYDLINADVVGSYVQAVSEQRELAEPFHGSVLFPEQRTTKRDFSYYKTVGKREIVIEPSAFDANAPLMPRGSVSKISSELPFFRMGDKFDENELHELNALLNTPGIDESLVRSLQISLMARPEELYRSALIRLESMRWQLLTTASIHVDASDDYGQPVSYDYNFDPDESWDSSNVVELLSDAQWKAANVATADPIGDIEDMLALADDVETIYMNKTTFNALSSVVRPQLTQSLAGTLAVTTKDVREQIEIAGEGANIVVYNKWYTDGDGDKQRYLPDGYVVFVPGGALGDTILGPTPEELVGETNSFDSNVVLSNGISLAQWVTPHPVKHNLAVSLLGMPVCPRLDEVFVLKAF